MVQTAKLLIRDVVTASETDTIRSVAKKMRMVNIGCVVITNARKPVGIFTERDMVNRVVAQDVDPDKTPVSKVMTANPISVDASEPLDKVFALLAGRKFRHVPITEEGRLAGLVSLTDLTKVLEAVYREDKYIQYFVDYIQKDATAANA